MQCVARTGLIVSKTKNAEFDFDFEKIKLDQKCFCLDKFWVLAIAQVLINYCKVYFYEGTICKQNWL